MAFDSFIVSVLKFKSIDLLNKVNMIYIIVPLPFN